METSQHKSSAETVMKGGTPGWLGGFGEKKFFLGKNLVGGRGREKKGSTMACRCWSCYGTCSSKKTEGLEICKNSIHDPKYHSYSGNRCYVYSAFKSYVRNCKANHGFSWNRLRHGSKSVRKFRYAFWTVTATWILYSGFNTIIFLAEMGAVSKEIYEAAIDGATPLAGRPLYYATADAGNVCGTCVTLASVAMVSQFDIIYMTTKGGPGTSTLNLPIYLYKAATLENNYGKANAVRGSTDHYRNHTGYSDQRSFREKKEAA